MAWVNRGCKVEGSLMPLSHYMSFKVIRSLYPSQYITFYLVMVTLETAVVVTDQRTLHLSPGGILVCQDSYKLCLVMETHTRSDMGNDVVPCVCALICSIKQGEKEKIKGERIV